jgi:photosystem II stability/assembly factor-like uncharacterized protein
MTWHAAIVVSLLLWTQSGTGQTFQQVYPDHEVHDYLALAHWSGDTVFAAGNNSGFMRSTDAGLTWIPVFMENTGYDFTRMGVNNHAVYLLPDMTRMTEEQFQDDSRMFIYRYEPRTNDTTRIYVPCPVPYRLDKGLLAGISVVDEGVFVVQSSVPEGSVNRSISILYKAERDTAWRATTLPGSISAERPAIYFTDPNRGFMFCEGAGSGVKAVYSTTDGGAQWTPVDGVGTYTRLFNRTVDRPAQWVDDTTFITTSDKYLLVKTTNMGKTWTQMNTIPTPGISSFHFLLNGTGIVSGELMDICRTTDYGETWQIIHPQYPYPVAQAMQSIVIDQSTSITAGYDGHILRTSDAGVTWDMPLLNEFTYSHVIFVSAVCGFSYRHYNLDDIGTEYCMTSDGGSSWTSIFEFEKAIPSSTIICPVDENQVWAVNWKSGTIDELVYLSTDGGRSWSSACRSSMFDTAGVSVPSGLYGSFACGRDSFMVYTDHGMLRTLDRGRTWEMLPQVLSIPRGSMMYNTALYNTYPYQWFFTDYQTLRSEDFGKTWTVMDSLPVRANNPLAILHATADGRMVQLYWEDVDYMDKFALTTDGGTTWEHYENAEFRAGGLTNIHQFANGTGFGLACNYQQRQREYVVYRSDDYWHTSTPVFSVSQSTKSSYSTGLYFMDPASGWMEAGPLIVRTTNGGIDWVQAPVAAPQGVALAPIHPNPMKAGTSTYITYAVSANKPQPVTIEVYDIMGRKVWDHRREAVLSGEHTVRWDTGHLRPGVYVVRLVSGNACGVRKVVVQ